MKQKILILIVFLNIIANSFGQNVKENNENILLINFGKTIKVKQIESSSQLNDSIKDEDLEEQFIYWGDDFSMFFYNSKKLFIDNDININNDSKAILWEYKNMFSTNNNEFEYEKIKFKIVNDSIIIIKILNNEHSLTPKSDWYSETINEIKQINNINTYIQTTYNIRNLGLIKKSSIVKYPNSDQFDLPAYLQPLQKENVAIRYNGDIDTLITYIYKKANSSDIIDKRNLKGSAEIEIAINNKGVVELIKFRKGITPEIDNELAKIIKQTQWSSCEYNEYLFFSITIDFDKK